MHLLLRKGRQGDGLEVLMRSCNSASLPVESANSVLRTMLYLECSAAIRHLHRWLRWGESKIFRRDIGIPTELEDPRATIRQFDARIMEPGFTMVLPADGKRE